MIAPLVITLGCPASHRALSEAGVLAKRHVRLPGTACSGIAEGSLGSESIGRLPRRAQVGGRRGDACGTGRRNRGNELEGEIALLGQELL